MTPASTRPSKLALALWVIAAGIACASAFTIPHFSDTPGDQEVYALAAERVVQGEQFYRPDQNRAFTYPPFSVLMFTPLVDTSEPTRRGIWYFANFLLLAAVVGLTLTRLDAMRNAQGPPRWIWHVAILLLAGRFVISPIEYQGHDQVLFLLTLLAILAWSRSQETAAGFWSGVGAATKATPALLLPVFLWNRQWKASGVFVGVGLVATLLPDLLYPNRGGGLWVTSWYEGFVSKVEVGSAAEASGAWTAWNSLNQSLAGTIYRLSTPVTEASANMFDVSLWSIDGTALKGLITLFQLGVLLILARTTWVGWTRDVPAPEGRILRLGQGGAVICAMLLLSPMTSKAHFCVLLLPIVFIVSDFLYRRRDPFAGIALAVVLLLGTASAKDFIGKSIGDVLLAYGALTWCTLACLLATSRIVAQRSRWATARTEPATPEGPVRLVLETEPLRPRLAA